MYTYCIEIFSYYLTTYSTEIVLFVSILTALGILTWAYWTFIYREEIVFLNKNKFESLSDEFLVAELLFKEIMKGAPDFNALVSQVDPKSGFYKIFKMKRNVESVRKALIQEYLDLRTEFSTFARNPPTDKKDLLLFRSFVPHAIEKLRMFQNELYFKTGLTPDQKLRTENNLRDTTVLTG